MSLGVSVGVGNGFAGNDMSKIVLLVDVCSSSTAKMTANAHLIYGTKTPALAIKLLHISI